MRARQLHQSRAPFLRGTSGGILTPTSQTRPLRPRGRKMRPRSDTPKSVLSPSTTWQEALVSTSPSSETSWLPSHAALVFHLFLSGPPQGSSQASSAPARVLNTCLFRREGPGLWFQLRGGHSSGEAQHTVQGMDSGLQKRRHRRSLQPFLSQFLGPASTPHPSWGLLLAGPTACPPLGRRGTCRSGSGRTTGACSAGGHGQVPRAGGGPSAASQESTAREYARDFGSHVHI